MVELRDINTVDALIDRVCLYHPEANADLLRWVYAFSNEAHHRQKRKCGTPYENYYRDLTTYLKIA